MLKKLFAKPSAASSEAECVEPSAPPFFILGCVRSGTTMLRDMLRLHPNLESPEETHFFRWSDPFKSPRFLHPYEHNPHIRKQQEMDGVGPEEFASIMAVSTSKSSLAMNYGAAFLRHRGKPTARWFDKTPQNIYGILLISAQIPEAKFVHIHRNPLNVVASLFVGKIMKIQDLIGAVSYWMESMQIMDEYKKANGDRVIEVAYESVTGDPEPELDRILRFLGEEGAIRLPSGFVHPERNNYRKVLTPAQVDEVIRLCAPYFERYGYSA